MDEKLRLYKVPTDEHVRLWRYMGVEKLVSLVASGTAYFRRLDLLEDQFESALSPEAHQADVDLLACEATVRGLLPEGVDPYEAAYLAVGSANALERATVFVNCWQRNDHESWAMWKNFGKDGVAIRSTVGRLRDAFNAQSPAGPSAKVPIGEVGYVDHGQAEMPCPFPWLYKNHMFSWEQEVRAWTFKVPRERSILGFNEDHPGGIFVPVNLDVLIDQVVAAPGSGGAFRGYVEALLAAYSLDGKPVVASAADALPDYIRIHRANRRALLDAGTNVPVHRSEPGS